MAVVEGVAEHHEDGATRMCSTNTRSTDGLSVRHIAISAALGPQQCNRKQNVGYVH
jgi:hypothetical protein